MAHRIVYKPQGIIFSSAVGSIDIDVDGEYVDVALTATGGVTVLSERYYAYGGRVTLFDLASLIESEMRWSGNAYADFTLRVYTDTTANKADSCILHVLYCDRYTVCTDVPAFLAENFLTTLSMRRVASGSTLSLFFFAKQGESVEYTISHSFIKKSTGATYRHDFTLESGKTASASGIVQLSIPQSVIVADAASFATVPLGDVRLLSFTVRCGQRSVSCFVDPTLNEREAFMFRNCFNVWETAVLPSLISAKTDVERSTVIINGSSRFYNQSATKTYEVEAGPLTSDEAEWIDQLFTSHDVMRIEENPVDSYDPLIPVPVLITDCTCEMQNGDEKLNKVKFIWRYADNRPIVRLSASPGIFTSPYNPVYS